MLPGAVGMRRSVLSMLPRAGSSTTISEVVTCDEGKQSRDEDCNASSVEATCTPPSEISLGAATEGEPPPVPLLSSHHPPASGECKEKQLQSEISKSSRASIGDNLPGMLPASTDPPNISGECQNKKLETKLSKSPTASAGDNLPGELPKCEGDSAGNEKAVASTASPAEVSAATVAPASQGTNSKPEANFQKPESDAAVVKGGDKLSSVLPKGSDDSAGNKPAVASAAPLDAPGLQGIADTDSKSGANTQKPEADAAAVKGGEKLPGVLQESSDDAIGNEKAGAAAAPSAEASVGIVAPKPQGLAARLAAARGKKGARPLVVKVSKEKTTACTQSVVEIPDGDFAKRYIIGEEVMPSVHRGMQVLFAKRRQDSLEVVIKKRCKEQSFARIREEMDWRANMELMLNLPKSENVCQLYEVLEDPKAYYVVMEKVEGKDLFESMDSEGPWPIDDARLVLQQLLDSVVRLHSEGYVHKNINLDNVMIDSPPSSRKSPMSNGSSLSPGQTSFARTVKLMHFDNVEEWTPMSPKAKQILGTDHYIAPEVYSGNYSQASDMFAVGVIAHKLIVGKFPFPRDFFDDKPGENYVGSPKMKQIKQRLTTYNIDFDVEVFKKEPDAFDFCKRLLDSNVNERLEAVQALQHPFIVKIGKRKSRSMLPRMIAPKAAES
eukprot:gnl/TRDRNA2_/TRDRNA2_175751_c3_seq2.p1 gnl/TRDRNA2_/TRDRNA2_175751_c3~~gnl/TRDRNA2_/TRDRNA2_175751_c3_seq2.p1  ORF type:complete len:666 (-),score=146.75 gnl/TRDRNA2_/TRDRNA2_175751_c3_seq2:154-2151(-)